MCIWENSVRDEQCAADPQDNPQDASQEAENDGFGQELEQDVRSLAPTDMRMPISRMRSVTETSMMFMIPIPPTSSEIEAIPPRRMVRMLGGFRRALGDIRHVCGR